MMDNVNYFCFGENYFHEILDTCSSEEITFEFSAPNRAYIISGECFDFSKTVVSKKSIEQKEAKQTLDILSKNEAAETLELLITMGGSETELSDWKQKLTELKN